MKHSLLYAPTTFLVQLPWQPPRQTYRRSASAKNYDKAAKAFQVAARTSATLLIGLFGGMGIQSWRDSVPAAATPTLNRSYCRSRSRILQRLPAQSTDAIASASQRQSPCRTLAVEKVLLLRARA